MRKILALIVLCTLMGVSEAKDLQIVVTFPNLKEDVKLIAPNDNVSSIAPAGVEPHDYQLTPDDIEALKKADVIISTAHAPFEVKIREMVRRGEIKAKLIEIPSIPDVRILTNPATKQPNYHMPIYDPENYKAFVRYLAEVLSELSNDNYKARAKDVIDEVDEIVSKTKKLNASAVADAPPAQYAVSWLNVDIRYLVVKEPDLPATPEDIRAIEKAIMKGEVQLVVVTKTESKASKALEELAKEKGIAVLHVPSPIAVESVPDKLKEISEEVEKLEIEKREGNARSPAFEAVFAVVSLIVVGLKLNRG